MCAIHHICTSRNIPCEIDKTFAETDIFGLDVDGRIVRMKEQNLLVFVSLWNIF
jgi:hypothetical protein